MDLVSIPTDTVPLDGLWYEAEQPRGAVLLLHGNTMNFYTGAPRFLPPVLVPLGFSCLAFNRRGHDILSIRDSRAAEGGAFQTAAEGRADTVFAARWLAERGFGAPFLVGHSNGGTLAAAHAAEQLGVRGLVLLSAHLGGPTILRVQANAGQLVADRFDEFVQRAERLVAAGRGDELLAVPGWWYVISAASLLDRLHATPDLVALAPAIRCPTLFLRGTAESPDVYPAERFAEVAGGACEVALVEGAEHFYVGHEDEVAQIVAGWLDKQGG